MTVTEFKKYVENLYAGAAQLEAQGKIPTGEAVQVARITLSQLMGREGIELPKS